jgi:hypothetical protein
MENIKNKLSKIIEQAGCETPKCKNCKNYNGNGCTFGCLNERVRITSPNYSCKNFDGNYVFEEKTIDNLKDLLKIANRLDEGIKNLDLLLDGKISEKDFNDIVG